MAQTQRSPMHSRRLNYHWLLKILYCHARYPRLQPVLNDIWNMLYSFNMVHFHVTLITSRAHQLQYKISISHTTAFRRFSKALIFSRSWITALGQCVKWLRDVSTTVHKGLWTHEVDKRSLVLNVTMVAISSSIRLYIYVCVKHSLREYSLCILLQWKQVARTCHSYTRNCKSAKLSGFSLHDLGSNVKFLHLQLWDFQFHGPCISHSQKEMVKKDAWLGNWEKHYLFWPCRIPSRLLVCIIEWHGPRLKCTLNFEDHTAFLTQSRL